MFHGGRPEGTDVGRLVLSGLTDALDTANAAASIAAAAAVNPYTSEVLCRIGQLQDIHAIPPQPVRQCVSIPRVNDNLGIAKFMPLLRGYTYAEQRPLVYPVAALLAVGVPFVLGYFLGGKR